MLRGLGRAGLKHSLVAIVSIAIVTGLVTTTPSATAATAASPTTLSAPICPGYSGLDGVNRYAAAMAGTFTPGWLPPVKVRYGTSVNWNYNPFRDTSWQSWYYSLKWLGALIRAGEGGYIYTGSGHGRIAGPAERWAALNIALGVTHDFLLKHPTVTSAPNFVEVSSMAHRAQFLACLAEGLGQAATPAWLVGAARAHAAYLVNSRHFLGANNRGMDQDLGVMSIGCLVGPISYRAAALTRLMATLKATIGSDGVPNEQAPGYAEYVYVLWSNIATSASRCQVTGLSTLLQRIALIPAFLVQATEPNGNLVQLGDTVAQHVGNLPGMTYTFTYGVQGTPPVQRVAIFPASGFIFGRSQWSPLSIASFYSLRYGPPIIGHGHYDRTSITWMLNGSDRLVDSGHVGYSNDALHKALIAPEAHNVLTIDPTPLISRANQTTMLLATAQTTNADSFLFSAQPYSWMLGSTKKFVADRRGVLIARNPDLLIATDFSSGAPSAVQWRQRWHLPVGWTAHVWGANRVEGTNGTNSMTLIRLPLGGRSPSARLVNSVQAPQLDVLRPNVDVQFGMIGKWASQVTVMVPAPASRVGVSLSGQLLTISVGASTQVVVRIGFDGSVTRIS
jgi:hypothetical protein